MRGKLAHPGCLICCMIGDRRDMRMGFRTHIWRKMKSSDHGIASFSLELASWTWLNTSPCFLSSQQSQWWPGTERGLTLCLRIGSLSSLRLCVCTSVRLRICTSIYVICEQVCLSVCCVCKYVSECCCVFTCVCLSVCVCIVCVHECTYTLACLCHEKQPSYYILLFLNWPQKMRVFKFLEMQCLVGVW